jgi:long-chain fatty acid transport protein
MSNRTVKSLLLACSGVAALICATADANAGGLAVREQSAYGQGSSYAGVAAGGSLSSMFWNPATLTQVQGIQSESSLTGIIPSSVNNANTGTGTGNVAISALVPSSYYSWQFNEKLWLGLSVNAPYGLAETFPDNWAGRAYAAGGENLKTYNAAPTVAYKFNDLLSVGFGAQIQYASASFTQGIAALGPTNQIGISGAGYGFGFTAGATLTPTPFTTIGLGYRSAINQKINGTMVIPNSALLNPPFSVSTPGSVNTTVNLPDSVSLGVRQKLTSQWTALGTVEWTNWSRIGNSNILQPNGAAATVGSNPVIIHFQYKDGWFFSTGAEYQWNEKLALRGGVAYELSPVSDTVRNPAVPDDDRFWLSVGATYKYSAKTSVDFAYSHVFVKSAPINLVDTSNPSFSGTVYTGSVSSQIDIISVGLHYRWDEPPAPVTSKLYHK